MAAVYSYLAGPFKVWYAPDPGNQGFGTTAADFDNFLGTIDSSGVRMTTVTDGEPIQSDLYGQGTDLDGIFQGTNLTLDFVLQQPQLAAVRAWQAMFNDTTGDVQSADEGMVEKAGLLWSQRACKLILDSCPDTSHATTFSSTPDILFGMCVLAPGFDMEEVFGAQQHVLPMRVKVLPCVDGADVRYWKRVLVAL